MHIKKLLGLLVTRELGVALFILGGIGAIATILIAPFKILPTFTIVQLFCTTTTVFILGSVVTFSYILSICKKEENPDS